MAMSVEATIRAHLDHLRDEEKSERTITDRGKVIWRLMHALPCGLAAAPEELRTWLNQFTKPKTKATYHYHLTHFYRWAHTVGALRWNPMEDVKPPKAVRGRPRPASDDQVAHIMANAAEPYLTWSKLAAYQGLRCCEVSGLDREHVTADELSVVGKGNKAAVLPTSEIVWSAIEPYPPGPIALQNNGLRRRSPNDVSSRTSEHFRDIGLPPKLALHNLRHWYGTTLLRQSGGNLRLVQELMRHESIETTVGYTLIQFEECRTGIRQLPTFS